MTGRPHHDRPARPTTLAVTAERIAGRVLLDADMPELGEWDAEHAEVIRAVIDELAFYVDISQQVRE